MHSIVFTQLCYVDPPKTPGWFDPLGIIIRESVPEMISYKTLKTTKYVVVLSAALQSTSFCLTTLSTWVWFYSSAVYYFWQITDEYLILDMYYNNA